MLSIKHCGSIQSNKEEKVENMTGKIVGLCDKCKYQQQLLRLQELVLEYAKDKINMRCENSNRKIGTCIERCIVERIKAGENVIDVFEDYGIKIKKIFSSAAEREWYEDDVWDDILD